MEFLVKAVSISNADPDKDKRGCYKKGYPVVVKNDGWNWKGGEGLPNFVLVKCPEVTEIEALPYVKEWKLNFDYTINNPETGKAVDEYNINVFTTNTNQSGSGGITQAMVNEFLSKWNAVPDTFGTNYVKFDIGIYNAIKSEFFWTLYVPDFDMIAFTELDYNSTTGIHRIEADYSYTAWGNEHVKVKARIEKRGCTFISQDMENSKIVFEIGRDAVRNAFKADIKQKAERVLYRRQYYFLESDVDIAISQGGIITLTKTQLLNKLKNKLDN